MIYNVKNKTRPSLSARWWQDEGVFAYGSASNFVILSGILVLIYAVVYSLLSIWRDTIRAKPTDAKQYNIPQISSKGQETESFQYEQTRKKARTGFPIAAGILTIIVSSIIMLFSGIFVFDGILTISSRYTSQGLNLLGDGLLGILVFAFALTSGIMTLKRKNFVFAILGMCFMVVKCATFIILTGNLLGVSFGIVVIAIAVISLIFTSSSYKEFS